MKQAPIGQIVDQIARGKGIKFSRLRSGQIVNSTPSLRKLLAQEFPNTPEGRRRRNSFLRVKRYHNIKDRRKEGAA